MADKMKREPCIRFNGFTEVWIQRKLGDTFIHLQNNTLSRAALSYKHGAALNIHYGDILIKYGEVLDVKKEILPSIIDESFISKYKTSFLKNGDVIVADTAEDETVGKCTEVAEITNEIVISGLHTIPYRPLFHFASGYLGFYMNSYAYHSQLLPLMQGIKVTSISKNAMTKIRISYPRSELEQKQIATLFNNFNNLINLCENKRNELLNVKKYFLNKMFPNIGKNSPEIHFCNFSEPWEQRKLGEVADIVGGGTPSTNVSDYWDGDIDWYAPAEISDQIYLTSSQRKITEEGYNNSSAKMLPIGTVLFTSRAGIGKTAILSEKGCTNQGFQSIVPHDDELDSYFIFSRTEELKRYGETVGAGSTFVEVSGKQMVNMDLMMPKTIIEQGIIGQYFRNLDHLITLYQQKLEILNEMKKSLIYQMYI